MKLKIPYAEKDSAKLIAKKYKVALYYAGEGLWNLDGSLPAELEKYTLGNSYTYTLDVPFADREHSMGARYHSLYKTYLINTSTPEMLPSNWRAQPYSYEAWIEKFVNGRVSSDISRQIKNIDVMKARDYQHTAYDMAMSAYKKGFGGFLIADDVGLGKTVSASIIAKEFKSILVVTTLAATAHWRRTFLNFNFADHDILIINYDRLQKLFRPHAAVKKTSKKKKNKMVAKSFDAPYFDLVVWDESQKLKNYDSQRSKLAMKIQLKSDFNLYLSATPGQNPLELSYLSPVLARVTGDTELTDFEAWCDKHSLGVSKTKFGGWKWQPSTESIDKMHTLLFKGTTPAAIRRVPEQIAGWPAISRILQSYEMESSDRDAYELSWQEFCTNYQKTNTSTGRQAEYLRFRQKSSYLKIPYVVEHAIELIDAGHSVAISVNFRDTLFELQKKLKSYGVSIIYGGQNAAEKEEQRLLFQTDVNQVVIFTVEEAISLHQGEFTDGVRPRSMIVHDVRWSGISMAQIEGRTHRDGKFSQIYWAYFDTTVDTQITQIVLQRLLSMKQMVGDDSQTLQEIERLLTGLSKKT